MEDTGRKPASAWSDRPEILVVDDCTVNRALLSGILRREGYPVRECSGGRECLEYCRECAPGLILLDVMMPDLDGIQVCSQLRRNYSKDELPVMIVSANSSPEEQKRGFDAGANDYLATPVERLVFLARLESHLSRLAAHREMMDQRRVIERSLETQKAVGDVLPDGLMIHDRGGKILYCNRQFKLFCGGISPATVGEAWELLYGGLPADVRQLYSWVAGNTLDVKVEEELEIPPNGGRAVQVISRSVELGKDRPLRLWLCRDMTHMRDLERKIKQQVKLETVSVFATGVAHNFNNLLGAILGAAGLLERAVQNDGIALRCLDVILRSVQNGRSLTNKMSNLVRKDTKKAKSLSKSLRVVISTVVEVQSALAKDGIRFCVDVPENLPPVDVASLNLFDIFTNVVNNAVEASSSGGVVEIRAALVSEGKQVEIIVKDFGTGMDQKTLERIFEPFFTTKNLDTRNRVSTMGNGLGLWNVHSLLQASGGDISISSALGEGTQVRMLLPVKSA